MRKTRTGRLCVPLTVCGLVLACSFSTPARQATPTETCAAPECAESGASECPPAEGAGQQPSPPAPAQPQGEAKPAETQKKEQAAPAPSGTSKDRLFYVLPNFLTLENAANVPPLTAGQKFKAVARGTFDPLQFVYYGFLAGVGQGTDDEPSFGQGALGYAKRYGTIFGDTTIENFMVGAVMPSLLHQDPRYFQRGKGGFGRRTWYAMTRIFVTRADSGRTQFNASEVLGSALGAGISIYTYHPEGDQKVASVMSVWGTQVGLDAVGNVFKEFWPDIRRHLHKKKAAPEPGG